MIKSMTGYGRGEYELFERKFVVEIKSVNHRYNDISITLPRVMASFEEKIKKTVSQNICRGKTDVYINFQSFSQKDIKFNFNKNLADAFVSELRRIDELYNFNQKNYLNSLLSFPDILTFDMYGQDENTLNEMWTTLENALNLAIQNINSMREKEGLLLKEDLLSKNLFISEIVTKIEELSPKVNSDLREKIFSKTNELLEGKSIDDSRVLLEITLLSDKMCIDEEIIRLKSHISQLNDILNEGGVCGRKLDFLIQEFNREANTIGSKSNDIDITKLVVVLKSEIEKIREQCQNIE